MCVRSLELLENGYQPNCCINRYYCICYIFLSSIARQTHVLGVMGIRLWKVHIAQSTELGFTVGTQDPFRT